MQLIRKLKSIVPHRHPLRLLWHRWQSFLAALRYGFPARKLTVVGVTGTDGKTTTVGMIAHILEETDHRYGAASTTFFEVNGKRDVNETHKTSIDPFVLQRFLRRLVTHGCTHAVLEISSHGLVQHRADFTWPTVAAVTNTTPEHLDYHLSMEQYRADKGRLFEMLRGKGTKVLNCDDGSFEMYSSIPSTMTMTFGLAPRHAEEAPTVLRQAQDDVGAVSKHLLLSDIHALATSTSATLHTKDSKSLVPRAYHLVLPIPGAFNLENAMCAIACCTALSIAADKAVEALRTFKPIPGRLERIEEGQPFAVFVDFAVSAASYEKTLKAIRAFTEPDCRVLILCGCCGNRMREKRSEIGRICSELADVVVVAGDETYGEDPRKVLEEVWAGVDRGNCAAHKIFNRREAIRFILQHAKPGDAVAICGMGPFTTMMTLEGEVPWDEREVVREVLQAIQKPIPKEGKRFDLRWHVERRSRTSEGGLNEVSPRGGASSRKPSPREAKISS
jgi:UDP-N-acetylmuramoyl-L-alanyl-D-glutamate--2,6-diaminopimelate ligase